MKKALLLIMAAVPLMAQADGLQAAFSSDNAYKPYYTQGFDSEDEFGSWTLEQTNPEYTWRLTPSMGSGIDFGAIDPDSKLSLGIEYNQSDFDETVTSPAISVRPNSCVEVYNYFSPVWLFEASWTLYATDVATGDTVQLLQQFLWANTSAYDETKWLRFRLPLDRVEGKTVTFSFNYKGNGGDSQLIDGFRVVQLDDSEGSSIDIAQGDSVSFADASQGNATSWLWEFEGGVPATSTERNPTVTYPEAGTYSVSLTVGDGTSTSTVTRQGYVNVKAEQPSALIGLPEEGYQSPFVGTLVPTGVPVTFRDLSGGYPTEWLWTFNGTDTEKSAERNPTVTYTRKGLFSVALQATNGAGTDIDMMQYAIQAGGAQYVWNLEIGESNSLAKLSLGFYGNYAGSNWLGLPAFAEHFKAPLAPATIDSVDVYFISNTTVTPDADITVSIRRPDADGKPGETLASASVKAGEIRYSDDTFLATTFVMDRPAEVTGDFFVVIEGMPNNSLEEPPYTSDDIAVACVRRNPGQKGTTWQLVEDQDEYGNPLGTSQWFENVDDAVSMAVCPVITYDRPETPDAITEVGSGEAAADDAVYTLQGVRVERPAKGSIYIRGGKKYVAR